MDDSQLERELAALEGEQAPSEQSSEAKPETPETETPAEGEEGQAETETEEAAEGDDADSGEASEGDEDGDGEDDEQPARPKTRSGIARLKQRLAAREAELEALRSRVSDSGPSESDIEREIGKPPKEEDYKGDFLAYERALTAYETEKRIVTRELKNRVTAAQEARQRAKAEAAEAHHERIEEFRGKVKDFDATLKSAANLKASPVVEDLILDSDNSAHLVYHLAKNPDRLAKLNAMSEREAAREIGRIEARLSLPQPKAATKAPAPKAPPKGGAGPTSPEKELDAWLAKKYGT